MIKVHQCKWSRMEMQSQDAERRFEEAQAQGEAHSKQLGAISVEYDRLKLHAEDTRLQLEQANVIVVGEASRFATVEPGALGAAPAAAAAFPGPNCPVPGHGAPAARLARNQHGAQRRRQGSRSRIEICAPPFSRRASVRTSRNSASNTLSSARNSSGWTGTTSWRRRSPPPKPKPLMVCQDLQHGRFSVSQSCGRRWSAPQPHSGPGKRNWPICAFVQL